MSKHVPAILHSAVGVALFAIYAWTRDELVLAVAVGYLGGAGAQTGSNAVREGASGSE